MIPAIFVFLYLAAVLYIGVFAFRKARGREEAEDYFLASRSLGPFVFLFSLFGTNMTAFAILGSSGHAFSNGIVTFGLMASSSGLVIPLTIFFIGTRVWALGKKHGFMTPVQMFRDRWECSHIGTVIFVVQAVLLVPYIIIGIMGGGTTLNVISGGFLWGIFFFFFWGGFWGGFKSAANAMLSSPALAPLLTRERISPYYYFSYTFIPLSAIAFPHILIFCLTAEKMKHFKKTVIFYPLCILAIWLPCVFLGVMANRVTDIPEIRAKQEARRVLATQGKSMTPEARDELREKSSGDEVIMLLLQHYAPLWLAGLLGAGIMAAVMASDSQILALSTMFTEDVFAFYGHKERFGESVQVHTGRLFIVLITIVAYMVALRAPETIFELAIQYAFSGFAALSPLLIGAIFWKGSTKWGALASTLWVATAVVAVAVFQQVVAAPAPGPPVVIWSLNGAELLSRTPGGTAVLGFMPVVPMVIVSALLMLIVSLVTSKPRPQTIAKYF